MWKTALLSRIRRHRIISLILITVAAISATVVVFAVATLGAPCPSNATPFQDNTMPNRTAYQLVPPGKATLCVTISVGGRLPLGGLQLAPSIGLYTTTPESATYSACSNSWTDCGGVAVTASPARIFLPTVSLHAVVTVNAPAGSTRGAYLILFPSCTTARIWLRIGSSNESLQPSPQVDCLGPMTSWSLTVRFDSYTGMTPVYQNGTSLAQL